MRTPDRARLVFVLCPLSFVLLLPGCGLSDYTGQMSSEAARAEAWDAENDLLGPPIRMPELPKKDDKDQIWRVFLRLPTGVSTTPETPEGSSQAKLFGPLVQYKKGNNAFGIANVYLGVSDAKDFANSVFNQFPGVSAGGDFVTIPRSLVVTGAGKKMPPTISVKQRLAEAQYLYSFNFYEHDGTQVAVVFQMEKGNGSRADAAIKASLATLGADDEVSKLSAIYNPHPLKR